MYGKKLEIKILNTALITDFNGDAVRRALKDELPVYIPSRCDSRGRYPAVKKIRTRFAVHSAGLAANYGGGN